MVGLGGLEPPPSPLSVQRYLVLQELTRPRGLPKYAEVVQDIALCGLSCGLGNQAFFVQHGLMPPSLNSAISIK
jgi:hypothetical protein